jgi:signal transduction histidine kinase
VLPALLTKTEAMNLLVEQLLVTAQIDDERLLLNFERGDLRQAMEEAVAAIRPLAGEGHRVVLELPLEEVPVTVDANSLRTILGNLLDNAIKYSPGGGEVLCSVMRLDDTAVATISDRGLGISRREMHRLFTRFGRVVTPKTSAIGGTGLGLFLSQELARRLGGKITAASRPGGGTVFSLTLPLLREDADR